MKLALPVIVVLAAWVMSSSPARANSPNDILIVANNAAGGGSLSISDVRDMFLKKRASWSNGAKIMPVNAPEGSSLRTAFRSKVLGMTSAAEQAYWQERKIKAGESVPPEFGDTLRAVFKMKGAIGYVLRSQFKEGTAKVLLVIPAG
jgi:ABC-type phosphate transport system substrate-binding protein